LFCVDAGPRANVSGPHFWDTTRHEPDVTIVCRYNLSL
jgi:hypothetical protein